MVFFPFRDPISPPTSISERLFQDDQDNDNGAPYAMVFGANAAARYSPMANTINVPCIGVTIGQHWAIISKKLLWQSLQYPVSASALRPSGTIVVAL